MRPAATSMFSSISTGAGAAGIFFAYSTAISECLRKKIVVEEEKIGIEADDLKDLLNDLWTLYDNFSDGRMPEDDGDNLGEDEG